MAQPGAVSWWAGWKADGQGCAAHLIPLISALLPQSRTRPQEQSPFGFLLQTDQKGLCWKMFLISGNSVWGNFL